MQACCTLNKKNVCLFQDADTRYTYCQDYLHSMTVVPVNIEALKKQEKLDSKACWKTEEGWIYPGIKTTEEDNVHPKKPHVAKVDELKEVRFIGLYLKKRDLLKCVSNSGSN